MPGSAGVSITLTASKSLLQCHAVPANVVLFKVLELDVDPSKSTAHPKWRLGRQGKPVEGDAQVVLEVGAEGRRVGVVLCRAHLTTQARSTVEAAGRGGWGGEGTLPTE